MSVTFNQISDLFAPYVDSMLRIQVSSELGTEPMNLADYECVKRYHKRILTHLKGVNEDGQSVSQMPPSGPLDPADIKLFEDWIADGMLPPA